MATGCMISELNRYKNNNLNLKIYYAEKYIKKFSIRLLCFWQNYIVVRLPYTCDFITNILIVFNPGVSTYPNNHTSGSRFCDTNVILTFSFVRLTTVLYSPNVYREDSLKKSRNN